MGAAILWAMKSVIVGTAGHIDHGKTSLVKALTGIDADRLQEEKRRGITIDIGFAYMELAAGNGETLRLGFVDVPGHERFVRNMLAGIGGIDLVMLVIAADEGIKPQTREHFDICRMLAIRRGLGADEVRHGGCGDVGGSEAGGRGLFAGIVSGCRSCADCGGERADGLWAGAGEKGTGESCDGGSCKGFAGDCATAGGSSVLHARIWDGGYGNAGFGKHK